MIPSIQEFPLEGKRVLIRCDLNVTMKDGKILDDTRIRESLATIRYALDHKAKVICMSHLGRPEGRVDSQYSLLPIAERMAELLDMEVVFPEDCIGHVIKKLISDLRESQLILLENLRFHQGETKNDPHFAEKLAGHGDIYINDAFGCSHRNHASIVGVVRHFAQAGMGFLVAEETSALTNLLTKPERPFYALLGGSKVSDKIEIMDSLMSHVNGFLIGGGMAYTFLAAQGYDIGRSLCETDKKNQAAKIIERCRVHGIALHLPVDSILATEPKAGTAYRLATLEQNHPSKPTWGDWMALDIGPKTVENFSALINTAKTIFWNGPMGVYEIEPFGRGTFQIARAIGTAPAVSVAGGGDCLAAIKMAGVADQFTHLSTGGGAAMEFLEGKQLPGLKALALKEAT